jgi:hypothetical protein
MKHKHRTPRNNKRGKNRRRDQANSGGGLTDDKKYELLQKIVYENLPHEMKERIGYVGF